MQARAVAKYVRISPRKARQVIDLIRGKRANEAISLLNLTPKKASHLVGKVLLSALANAQQKEAGLNPEELYVREAYANGGPTLRRFRARAMGRAGPILKRTSHITVVVEDREEL